MKISLNWLKEYVDIDCTPEELADTLTTLGLEIESVERPGGGISGVFVGQILAIEKHPEADKIVICQTDVGQGAPLQICCGATNMKVGDKVPTAIDGAVLPGDFKIAKRKMRGVESHGMMCSGKELGVGDEHSGLLILPADTPVGIDAKQALGLDDVIFEIEVTPNRADWASMIGVARELAALWGKQLRIPSPAPQESGNAVETSSSVTLADSEKCRRYVGRVIEGITVAPSPEWLANRLRAAGQRPINNVVDVTNYVLMETGQPLHAFNLDNLSEGRIVVRTAKSDESIRTLDGETRKLDTDMLVIADAEKAQCVAGVMGGADSEVGEGCTRIFLETAWFDPRSVRKTSRKLNLASESSQRFQRGADPEMAIWASDRAAELIQQVAGGSVRVGRIDAYPTPMVPAEVTLRYARTNAFLGSAISAERQRGHLIGLGFEVVSHNDEAATLRVPLRRNDVSREVDLIEEIARMEGFGNLPSTLPRVRSMVQVMAPEELAIANLKKRLTQVGLTEVRNWSFTNAEALKNAGIDDTAVPLANPLSEKQALMRPSLAPSLLETAAYNLNRGADRLAIFELAPTYHPSSKEDALSTQQNQLAVLLAGGRSALHWSHGEGPAVDFYDIKGIAESLLESTGLSYSLAVTSNSTLQEGQAVEILSNNKRLGYLGKVSPQVAKAHGIEKSVYLLHLSLDVLLKTSRPLAEAKEISAYPASTRDIAVLVDRTLSAADLLSTAQKAGGTLLQGVQVFDVYAGKNVPEDKKSIALRLTFQSYESTLTDAKIEKSYSKILKTLEHQFNAVLR